MPNLNSESSQGRISAAKQPRRLLLALVLLLVTLAVALVKERDFWFGVNEAQESNVAAPQATATTAAKSAAKVAAQPASIAAHVAKKPVAAQTAAPQKDAISAAQPADSGAVATNRTAVPPLDVEVVAGDSHRTVRPGSNAAKVEIANSTQPASASTLTVTTNAAQHERIPSASLHVAAASTTTEYPLLAQQMKVQGSVVLQALISCDGAIEDLRVVSGPSVLISAAQQAVREWRFKPYFENGQAVETKARITVNFTIKIGDSSKSS